MLLQQAFAIIQFKVEAAVIQRRPAFAMAERCLLHRLSQDRQQIQLDQTYPLINGCFQLVDPDDPYRLTAEEHEVLQDLLSQFQRSPRLAAHMRFLVEHGTLYQRFNDNLLYHGCLPCRENGDFLAFNFQQQPLAGKALMDFFSNVCRKALPNQKTKQTLPPI